MGWGSFSISQVFKGLGKAEAGSLMVDMGIQKIHRANQVIIPGDEDLLDLVKEVVPVGSEVGSLLGIRDVDRLDHMKV